jgi:hypothetical protein
MHCNKPRKAERFLPLFYLFFLICLPLSSLALDGESDREAIISARSKKFYHKAARKIPARKYLSLGGNRSSSDSSKSQELNIRYLHHSDSQIHQFDFEQKNYYSNQGSSSNKLHLVKKSELYDGTISSKFILGETRNYGVIYHRTIYDDLSDYYRDQRTAVGAGRMFFDGNLELDASIGYQEVKEYGYKVSFIPSMRLNFKLSENFSLNQRGYLFIDHKSMDNDLRTALRYRLSDKASFEIRHNFEQRRYEDSKKRKQENQVNRSITFNLVFNLG